MDSVRTDLIRAIVGKEEFKYTAKGEWNNFNPESYVLMSLQDPSDNKDMTPLFEKFKDFINLKFWDVEEDFASYFKIKDEQAKELLKFILKNRGESFFIHCSAGMSRSAGVGMAIECILKHNGDKSRYSLSSSPIKNHPRYFPNMVVFDAIVDAL